MFLQSYCSIHPSFYCDEAPSASSSAYLEICHPAIHQTTKIPISNPQLLNKKPPILTTYSTVTKIYEFSSKSTLAELIKKKKEKEKKSQCKI